ncbi:class I SAM-dependent methyltransferase [Spongiactinospora sp. TRM90649]|uniref:class I SAM-dependent methyltransferase n=1 Tax=Spongiactinospora sp. TRM90649 TaxID=3031114 RepID=UPI0023F8E16A|nr:class I SAM-dependent methyltransferase [Spongiactinospora sp. TRM90649]MDF5755576.1 class I SAM-dependent methyltransferase [Spongiactinospora sp. TRM90649]
MASALRRVLVIRAGEQASLAAGPLRVAGLDVHEYETAADLDGYSGLLAVDAEAVPHLLSQARAAGLPLLTGPLSPERLAAFAALVADSPAYRSAEGTRAFFSARAATWEEKFPDDGPAFAAAIAELAPVAGGTVLDAGCGTGRAMPLLREAVTAEGRVIGADLTPEMIASARERGRAAWGTLLIADVARLPLRDRAVDAVLAAGLLSHLPDPAAVLAELARIAAPGARLALFHPVGRAVLAARHGRRLTPADPRAERNLRPMLTGSGWSLIAYDDTDTRYLALAVRSR